MKKNKFHFQTEPKHFHSSKNKYPFFSNPVNANCRYCHTKQLAMVKQISAELVIGGRWAVQEELGSGGQATVYKAYDFWTQTDVAVKIHQESESSESELLREKSAYEEVMKRCCDGHQSFLPTLHHYEKEAETEMMVIELLGPTLLSLMGSNPFLFDLQTVIHIFKQSLTCLEKLHKTGLIHRDIKPNNICVGKGNNINDVRLIDLVFCERYIDEQTGKHKQLQYGSDINGTVLYCSLNQQKRGSASRSDDLEALCYTMMCIEWGA